MNAIPRSAGSPQAYHHLVEYQTSSDLENLESLDESAPLANQEIYSFQ